MKKYLVLILVLTGTLAYGETFTKKDSATLSVTDQVVVDYPIYVIKDKIKNLLHENFSLQERIKQNEAEITKMENLLSEANKLGITDLDDEVK